MNFIKWSEQYSVNIKEIDEQHKNLIKLINRMHKIVITGGGKTEIEELFEELFNYTNYHFNAEEQLFKTYHYPDWQAHQKEHDDLIIQLLKLKVKLIKGNQTIPLEMFAFLNNWLVNHILNSDRKYSSYLHSKGVF